MSNPIGLFIQGQDPNLNRARLFQHLAQANYTTISVMDNLGLAKDIKSVLPRCVVIHRHSDWEPAPGAQSFQDLRNLLLSYRDSGIVLMVNCEQGFSPERCEMWSTMILIAATFGVHLCVGNMASGTVKCGQGGDPNEWTSTQARHLLATLIDNPGNLLGVHEYTSFFTWLVANGGWGEPSVMPVHVDWTKPQWHLGRNLQGIMAACRQLSLPFERLRLVITEGFLDNMNDVASHYPGISSDGWASLVPWWRTTAFPDRDPELTLVANHVWAWEKVYAPLGEVVVGAHVFCYGNASGDPRWNRFRVDWAATYLAAMEAYQPDLGGTPLPGPVDQPPSATTVKLTATFTLEVPEGIAEQVRQSLSNLVWRVDTDE